MMVEVYQCNISRQSFNKLAGIFVSIFALTLVYSGQYPESSSLTNVHAQQQVDALPVYDRKSNLYPIDAVDCEDGSEICEFNLNDDNLFPLEYRIFNSDGSEEKGYTMVYKRPHVSTFYNSSDVDMRLKQPRFQGFAGKFFNLSPWRVTLFWIGGNQRVLMNHIEPFQAYGMATFPSHNFVIVPYGKREDLKLFSADPKQPLCIFDAIEEGLVGLDSLGAKEKDLYFAQLTNLNFAKRYKEFTGADWLAMFPKSRPIHDLWPADFFGQMHQVESEESHFILQPPNSALSNISYRRESASAIKEKVRRDLKEYREPQHLTLNMTVISCSPRVFEIDNFLSDVEVDHILELGTGRKLFRSSVSGGSEDSTKTRTSKNTWVNRESSPIVDAVYRRAADLLGMDEGMLRYRGDEDEHLTTLVKNNVAITEELQLVHYDVGQEYTAHHDFMYPPSHSEYQNARLATILLYLNEGMVGGSTTFPRWVNSETREELAVTPKRGKAVLFYSQLPDGNYDDLSQHAAKPVRNGEKWLTNLWVWDPVRSH